jgi:hypothetical protein
MKMKEIGGFFELEFSSGEEYHSGALRFNTARSALYHLIKGKNIKRLHLPYYVCESILEPLVKLGVGWRFYRINEQFQPIIHFNEIAAQEYVLYINYFGVNGGISGAIGRTFDRVILDNTQAFYDKSFGTCDTIYSPRKFFGVPDGGYLYTKSRDIESIEDDVSFDRADFLLKRIDCSAQDSYSLFQQNENRLSQGVYRGMSKLTCRILQSIDYEKAKRIRNENFRFLHREFGAVNELSLSVDNLCGPMVYPLLISKEGIRERLISHKIYVATYWKNVLSWTENDWFEKRLTQYLLPLPIDQRYGYDDMARIVDIVKLY